MHEKKIKIVDPIIIAILFIIYEMDDKYDFENILKNKSYDIMWLKLSDQSDFLHR